MIYQLKKVFSGFSTFLVRLVIFLFVISLCLLFSFAIVFPLWKLAVTHTKIYTIISLFLLSAIILGFIVKKLIKSYQHNPHHFFHNLIKKTVLLSGFSLFLFFIFHYQRMAAFLVLALFTAIYIFLLFGSFENKH